MNGWNEPINNTIQVQAGFGNVVVTNLYYAVVPPVIAASQASGLSITGTANTSYDIQYSTSLNGPWTLLKPSIAKRATLSSRGLAAALAGRQQRARDVLSGGVDGQLTGRDAEILTPKRKGLKKPEKSYRNGRGVSFRNPHFLRLMISQKGRRLDLEIL